MPKLVSMKIDPKVREKKYAESALGDRPLYPWGLELRLDEEAMELLGMAKLPPAGAVLMVTAKADVTGSNSRDEISDDGTIKTCRSLTLQITDIALEDPPAEKASTESKLYKA